MCFQKLISSQCLMTVCGMISFGGLLSEQLPCFKFIHNIFDNIIDIQNVIFQKNASGKCHWPVQALSATYPQSARTQLDPKNMWIAPTTVHNFIDSPVFPLQLKQIMWVCLSWILYESLMGYSFLICSFVLSWNINENKK